MWCRVILSLYPCRTWTALCGEQPIWEKVLPQNNFFCAMPRECIVLTKLKPVELKMYCWEPRNKKGFLPPIIITAYYLLQRVLCKHNTPSPSLFRLVASEEWEWVEFFSSSYGEWFYFEDFYCLVEVMLAFVRATSDFSKNFSLCCFLLGTIIL